MPKKTKYESASVMVMDMHGFSGLSSADHHKVIEILYPELSKIVHVGHVEKLLDRKTIGDGFVFYFSNPAVALEAAINVRMLFRENRFWTQHAFEKTLACRIGLHFGQFSRIMDAIEQREALFGRNIITAARLEPVVRLNEIWCTNSFKAEANVDDINKKVKFVSLGKCQLAKEWSEETVHGVYLDGVDPVPLLLSEQRESSGLSHPEPTVISYRRHDDGLRETYFALVRLKHRSDGVEHLKRCLASHERFLIEAVYYLFGDYDILVRFKAAEPIKAKRFSKILEKGKIIWPDDRCELTHPQFDIKTLDESIVILPQGDLHYMKAFTFIKSSAIASEPRRIRDVLGVARKACKWPNSIVTHYNNSDAIILPIVIPTQEYYALAKAIEGIEALIDRRHWQNVSIITYPVHGFEEMFETSKKKHS